MRAGASALRPAADALRPTAHATWDSGTYLYDGSGNITNIGAGNVYVYDPLSRLKRANLGTNTEIYRYDGFGNLKHRETNGAAFPVEVSPSTNRLIGATYDPAGNLTAIGVQTYAYDPFSMMRRRGTAPDPDPYVYTADDERIGVRSGNYWLWSFRNASGKVIRQYESIHDAHMLPWRWVEDYVYRDGLLLGAERVPEEGGRRHFHLDHLGTLRLITGENGLTVSQHDYFPFGNEITPLRQETLNGFDREEPMKFTGHERDFTGGTQTENTNYLDYMHARSTNASWGRFLSPDPIGGNSYVPQSWNRYAYALNNPLKYVDPDGRAAETFWDAFNIGLGLTSLGSNLSAGNYGAAAVDTGGLLLDAAATAVPFIPGGAGTAIRAARLADNVAMGRMFESAVLDALGASKNTGAVSEMATRVGTIPDLAIGSRFGVRDIKNVQSLSFSKQLQSQFSAAKTAGVPFNLIVSPRTQTISAQLQRAIQDTGGKILVYDPKRKKFYDALFEQDTNRLIRQ